MATLVLSAAGAALGSSLGGSVLGLSMSAVGRFAGATLGRAIDQRVLGGGARSIETGRLDRLRRLLPGMTLDQARPFLYEISELLNKPQN